MPRKVRYRTAQLKATHKEKKKTTGSVARRSKSKVSRGSIGKWSEVEKSGDLTKRSVNRYTDHLCQRLSFFICLHFPPDPLADLYVVIGWDVKAHEPKRLPCRIPVVEQARFPAEQNTSSSFLEEAYDEKNQEPVSHHLNIEDPSPQEVLGDEPGAERAKSCAKERCTGKKSHRLIAVSGVVDIAHDTPNHGGEGATADAGEKTGGKHAAVRLGESAAQLTNHKQDARCDKDRLPSVQLREGSQDHWGNGKPCREHSDANVSSYLTYAPFSHHLFSCRTVRASCVGGGGSDGTRQPYRVSLAGIWPVEWRDVVSEIWWSRHRYP